MVKILIAGVVVAIIWYQVERGRDTGCTTDMECMKFCTDGGCDGGPEPADEYDWRMRE